MDHVSPKKCRVSPALATNQDIICTLPDEIEYMILGLLPVQESVQTSVLSSQWHHKWAIMLKLFVCEYNCISPTLGAHMLLASKNLLTKFSLSTRGQSKHFSFILNNFAVLHLTSGCLFCQGFVLLIYTGFY